MPHFVRPNMVSVRLILTAYNGSEPPLRPLYNKKTRDIYLICTHTIRVTIFNSMFPPEIVPGKCVCDSWMSHSERFSRN